MIMRLIIIILIICTIPGFMQAKKMLRDDPKRNKGNLSASGAPTNYLVDQTGRIIFSHFHINDQNERTLELMISELPTIKNIKCQSWNYKFGKELSYKRQD